MSEPRVFAAVDAIQMLHLNSSQTGDVKNVVQFLHVSCAKVVPDNAVMDCVAGHD